MSSVNSVYLVLEKDQRCGLCIGCEATRCKDCHLCSSGSGCRKTMCTSNVFEAQKAIEAAHMKGPPGLENSSKTLISIRRLIRVFHEWFNENDMKREKSLKLISELIHRECMNLAMGECTNEGREVLEQAILISSLCLPEPETEKLRTEYKVYLTRTTVELEKMKKAKDLKWNTFKDKDVLRQVQPETQVTVEHPKHNQKSSDEAIPPSDNSSHCTERHDEMLQKQKHVCLLLDILQADQDKDEEKLKKLKDQESKEFPSQTQIQTQTSDLRIQTPRETQSQHHRIRTVGGSQTPRLLIRNQNETPTLRHRIDTPESTLIVRPERPIQAPALDPHHMINATSDTLFQNLLAQQAQQAYNQARLHLHLGRTQAQQAQQAHQSQNRNHNTLALQIQAPPPNINSQQIIHHQTQQTIRTQQEQQAPQSINQPVVNIFTTNFFAPPLYPDLIPPPCRPPHYSGDQGRFHWRL